MKRGHCRVRDGFGWGSIHYKIEGFLLFFIPFFQHCEDENLFCEDENLFCEDENLFCEDENLFWAQQELNLQLRRYERRVLPLNYEPPPLHLLLLGEVSFGGEEPL